MAEATKACNLTENEIHHLLMMHGHNIGDDCTDACIERLNYLNKRLKAFKEPEETKPAVAGWGTPAKE